MAFQRLESTPAHLPLGSAPPDVTAVGLTLGSAPPDVTAVGLTLGSAPPELSGGSKLSSASLARLRATNATTGKWRGSKRKRGGRGQR
jgi:hypothetical protein